MSIPKKNESVAAATVTVARRRCAWVIRAATSATAIAADASNAGCRTSASPAIVSPNAQRNPATVSARRGSTVLTIDEPQLRSAGGERAAQSGGRASEGAPTYGAASSRPTHTGSAGRESGPVPVSLEE